MKINIGNSIPISFMLTLLILSFLIHFTHQLTATISSSPSTINVDATLIIMIVIQKPIDNLGFIKVTIP